MSDIPEPALGSLLHWAHEFSRKLPDEQRIEMRVRILQFVCLGFAEREPGFDVQAVAEGRDLHAAQRALSLAQMLGAFRFYQARMDPRAVLVAQLTWDVVGAKRAGGRN